MMAIQVSGDGKSCFRGSGPDEVQDFLITKEWLTGPVFGDFREESMLNGVPLGSAGRIVSDGDVEIEGIGELRLDFGFPTAATTAVAAAGICENENLTGLRVLKGSFTLPPASDRMSRKSRSVVRDADNNRAAVGKGLVDTVRNGNADRVGAEVVIVDRPCTEIPTSTVVFEVSNQFTLFGIHADDGQVTPSKTLA